MIEERGGLKWGFLLALMGLIEFALELGEAAFLDGDLSLFEHELFVLRSEVWEVGEKF